MCDCKNCTCEEMFKDVKPYERLDSARLPKDSKCNCSDKK